MGLASSLSTALTGLQAAETVIDVTGNNLANANTVGFKASEAHFATQLLQTLSLGSGPTATSGGTNPRQLGLGTQVAEITPDFSQGTIQISTNPMDMAIQGDGFFIVQGDSGTISYTRNGVFKTNSDNELVMNGHRLLGHGVDDNFQVIPTTLVPLTIPLGGAVVAEPTENVFLEGMFIPNGDIADQAAVVESAVLGDGIAPQADSSTSTSAAASIPDESGSTAASSAAAGALVPGATYRYRYAFVDPSGQESLASLDSVPPGASPAVTVAPANTSVTLSNIPSDATPGSPYTAVNIYRTLNGGADYFLVGQAAAGAASFVDGTADGAVRAQLDETDLDGNYTYYITYFRAGEEESRPSDPIGPINVTNNRVLLTNLPAAPPPPPPGGGFPAYDMIRIYRNLASDASSFHLVDTIPFGQDYTDAASDATIQANQQLDFDGQRMDSNTLLTNVVLQTGTAQSPSYDNVFTEGTLTFTGTKGGRELGDKTFDITATSTVQELVDFMTEALGIQPASADPTTPIPGSVNTTGSGPATLSAGGTIEDGRFRFVSNNGTGNAVDIDPEAFHLTSTTGVESDPFLQFATIQDAVGESVTTEFIAYDSLGIPVNARLTAVLESQDGTSTTYRWFADSSDNDPLAGSGISVGTGTVTFDGEGNIVGTPQATVSVRRDNIPSNSPLSFDLDFSGVSGLAADQGTLNVLRQDGSAPGTLSSFIIGEDGRIRGIFTNGVTRDLGQIRLARFTNPAGLEQLGGNLFGTGINSGLPVEADPGLAGLGQIKAGALELSNTDVGQNLIDLILASTHYRSNTRVITTAQQLLDELLNLRR